MINLDREKMHHAYLIKGGEESLSDLLEKLESIDLKTHGSPDFFLCDTDTFSIEDARTIKVFQSELPVVGDTKLIVINTKYFSHPAQHALLKVFEEPKKGVHFFVLTPQTHLILPTLRSRLYFVDNGAQKESGILKEDVVKFLKSTKEDRLSFLDKKIKEFKEEETAVASKGYFSNFLDLLELEISSSENKDGLSIIWKAKDYINDQGSSIKNLMEMVALTI